MEQANQPKLDLETKEQPKKLPFNLKAKIISIERGISYREAFGLALRQEAEDKAKERAKDHAP